MHHYKYVYTISRFKISRLLYHYYIGYLIAYATLGGIRSVSHADVLVCILGMAMSNTNSHLHHCSILVSHDILESIRRVHPITDSYKIRVAKLTLRISGLLAMIVPIYCNDLFKLMLDFIYFIFTAYNYTATAPFILAVFGFRSPSRVVLIGMVIGILSTFL